MNHYLSFWLVQVMVWGSFTLLNMLVRGYFVNFNHVELINSLTLFIALMLSSAFMKKFYQQRNPDTMPQVIKYSVLGSVIGTLVAVIVFAIVLLPNKALILGSMAKYAYLQILSSIPFLFTLLLCWSSVYLLIKRQYALRMAQIRERELNEQLATSQMDLLLNQLNPHFMFNAINNIRALILEDTEKARESLAQLSDVLRVTLQAKQDKLWPLAQEIELTKSFITLNELQFEDRLTVQWDIRGNIDSWQVPTLSLQLLVENAIKHGIAKKVKGGEIIISISAFDTLVIEVTNPGNIEVHDNSLGLGIVNIQQRLQYLFGEFGTCSLQQEGKLVKAQIKLDENLCSAP
ncbi:sensor histidine kinase [Thalassotalea ganghwensis]